MIPSGLKKALYTGAFFVFTALRALAVAAETAEIRHVFDGDSFVLADGREGRLIGINTPEFGKDGAPNQPLAEAARDRLARLIEGRQVMLSHEQERQDRYGRWLVHVQLPDGTSAQELLLREGLAWAVAIPPNIGKLSSLLKLEDEARAGRRGVWSQAAYAPKPAEQLTPADTGFRFIEGRVQRRAPGRRVIYFDLAPRVALVVPRGEWQKYFAGKSADLVGRRVVARGWLTESKGRLHLRVPHPAMLTSRD